MTTGTTVSTFKPRAAAKRLAANRFLLVVTSDDVRAWAARAERSDAERADAEIALGGESHSVHPRWDACVAKIRSERGAR